MAGDVYVRVSIKKHKLFQRKGADLWIKKKITLLEALTGLNFELT
jgi:DnaJ family protein A protein 2